MSNRNSKQYLEQDKAIEYHAKLTKINSILNRVKELNLNTDKIEQEIQKIKIKVEEKEKHIYTAFDTLEKTEMFSDNLKNNYEYGIKQLDKIIDILLKENETYCKVFSNYKELNLKLKNPKQENLANYIEETKILLRNLNTTSTIDYDMEDQLVENIYRLAYQVIKLEILHTKKSILLEYIKNNEIDISYIQKYIEEDIQKLDFTKEEYQDIDIKRNELNKKSLQEANLLDPTLIYLLELSNNIALQEEIMDTFLATCTTVEERQSYIIELQESQKDLSESIANLMQENKKNFLKKFKKNIFLIGNFLSLGAILTGLFSITKAATSSNLYKTTIETYDSRTGYSPPINSDESKMEEYVRITEYLPWIEPGYFRSDYTREIYTYELTDPEIDYQDLTDYINSELTDPTLFKKIESITQTKSNIEDLYKESIYIIEKLSQDLENPQKIPNIEETIIVFFFELLMLLCIDIFITFQIYQEKFQGLTHDAKNTKQLLQDQKKKLLELNETLNEAIYQYKKLQKNIQKTYKNQPLFIQKNPKIKRKVKQLKELPSSEIEKNI